MEKWQDRRSLKHMDEEPNINLHKDRKGCFLFEYKSIWIVKVVLEDV